MSQGRKYDTNAIKVWMRDHVEEFLDDCGEVNCTSMVEEWDRQRSTGMETLDMNHPAWDIAVMVAAARE
jgi:hypothetical protein